MKQDDNIEHDNRSGNVRNLGRLLILAGLALVLVWIGLKAFRIVAATRSLAAREEEAAALMQGDGFNVDPVEVRKFVLDTRADVLSLKSAIEPFDKVLPALSWIPKIGATLASGPQLLTIADSGSEAAVYAITGLEPALTLMQEDSQGDESKIPQLLQIINDAQPELALAAKSTDHAMTARNRIGDVDGLVEPVQGLVKNLDQTLPFVQNSLEFAQVLPALMGMEGSRTYLILAQNEDELRPTGGYISGAGIISVDKGQIQSIKFDNSELVDDWINKPYHLPPEPFNEFMGMDIFLFRDANFWPDFRKSAEQAMTLYSYGQDVQLDGVIAIDQRFIQLLLDGTGPLEVPELEMVVNSNNVIDQIRIAWGPGPDQSEENRKWVNERKDFMEPLAKAFKEKLVTEFLTINPISLGQALLTGLDEKHLQIYLLDPEIAAVLAKTGWDGSITSSTGQDFLMVVDTNMGFNKVNAVVEKQVNYKIGIDENGNGHSQLAIHYDHTSSSGNQSCDHGTRYNTNTQYIDLFDDCYWNYLRIYLPGNSNFIDASQHYVDSELFISNVEWPGKARFVVDENSSSAVIDNFFLLAPGQQLTSTFEYKTPGVTHELPSGNRLYQITIDKQAGIDNDPIQVVVEIPPGARLVKTNPGATRVNGQEIVFVDELDTDLTLQIEYQ